LFGNDRDSGHNSSDDGYYDEKKNASSDVNAESHVLVQLWDTAGKERLKPQKCSAQYDKSINIYEFLSIKPSAATNNSNYEHRYNNWGFINGIAEHENSSATNGTNDNPTMMEQKEIVRKRHDTKQNHGRPPHYNRGRPHHYHRLTTEYLQENVNEPMGDALFRNIDACMLVYDATSSMSFLHLMQWHSEWVQKLNHWEREELEKDQTIQKRKTGRRKRIPFIVVANKLDLLEGEREKSQEGQSSSVGEHRRSVMGFRGGEYKGRELKYEYAAENTTISQCECGDGQNQPKCQLHSNIDPATKRSERNNYPTTKRLTYSLKETLWSTDATYLNALQLTEDQLAANRLMILLWCQRNGIPHVEASALNGRGVDEAMEHLIKIGVEELGVREMEKLERRDDRERFDTESREAAILQEKRLAVEGIVLQESGVLGSSGIGPNTQNVDRNSSLKQNNGTSANNNTISDAATASTDPSQYYFLYQPRQDEKLDLFARYSPKEDQRCSPFKCWLSLFSYCQG